MIFLPHVSANILIFLLIVEASDNEMVLAPSIMHVTLGCLTTSWRLPSSPTSESNVLRMKFFCDGSHSACMEVWLFKKELVAEVVFPSWCDWTGVAAQPNRAYNTCVWWLEEGSR